MNKGVFFAKVQIRKTKTTIITVRANQNGNPLCVDCGMNEKTHPPISMKSGSVAKKKK
jgi:hypothetical protein